MRADDHLFAVEISKAVDLRNFAEARSFMHSRSTWQEFLRGIPNEGLKLLRDGSDGILTYAASAIAVFGLA